MRFTLRKIGLSFLLVYGALFLDAFLKQWLPVDVATPEFDLSLLGFFALEGPLWRATLLGFWNGLLRDSLTVGPSHGWTVSLMIFSWALAFWIRGRRIGLAKKAFLFFGGLLGIHTLLFRQVLLPVAFMTSIAFLFGIRFLHRWLSDSVSE